MTPVDEIQDSELVDLAREASSFLASHPWCQAVGQGSVAFAIPGVLAVLAFQVVARTPAVDPNIWVVVGDLPSAYIAQPPDAAWQDVLAGYVFEMRRWVAAVQSNSSTEELIPVGVAPTHEHAIMLAGRLDFIEDELLARPADSIENPV